MMVLTAYPPLLLRPFPFDTCNSTIYFAIYTYVLCVWTEHLQRFWWIQWGWRWRYKYFPFRKSVTSPSFEKKNISGFILIWKVVFNINGRFKWLTFWIKIIHGFSGWKWKIVQFLFLDESLVNCDFWITDFIVWMK